MFKNSNKLLAEDCLRLSISDLPKRLLQPADKETYIGKSGEVFINNGKTKIQYKVVPDRQPIIALQFNYGGLVRWQTLHLDTATVHFGERPYFECDGCFGLKHVLYLRTDNPTQLACRECLNIKYQLANTDRRTKTGVIFHAMHFLAKINSFTLKRGLYNGKLTRQARSMLRFKQKCLNDANALDTFKFKLKTAIL